jgi:hypothetical protein
VLRRLSQASLPQAPCDPLDNTRLTLIKEGLAERLKDVEPRTEALAAFGAAEAGKLQISAPRPMVVKERDDDVIALFLRLLEDPELQRRERRTPKPDLAPIVRQLQRRNVPIQRRPEVSVPVLDVPSPRTSRSRMARGTW